MVDARTVRRLTRFRSACGGLRKGEHEATVRAVAGIGAEIGADGGRRVATDAPQAGSAAPSRLAPVGDRRR